MNRRDMLVGGTFLTALLVLGATEWALDRAVGAQDRVVAPRFEVDPFWPKPLPNNWVLGETIGLGIDSQDHVWIVHRADRVNAIEGAADQNPPTAACIPLRWVLERTGLQAQARVRPPWPRGRGSPPESFFSWLNSIGSIQVC